MHRPKNDATTARRDGTSRTLLVGAPTVPVAVWFRPQIRLSAIIPELLSHNRLQDELYGKQALEPDNSSSA